MNIFHKTDLQSCDPKVNFGRKLKTTPGIETMNNMFEVRNGAPEGLSKTNMTFKYIMESSGVIPAQFPYIKICFLIKFIKHR